MRSRHVNLLLAAAENVVGNWTGYAVAASGLFVALTLLASGVAISEGIKAEALDSVRAGADVYCTWDMFGRDAPVPRRWIDDLAAIPGVIRAVPRIIGRVPMGGGYALVVGVPFAALAAEPIPLDGSMPRSPAEVLVGAELAHSLGVGPGSHVALDAETIRVFTVAGVVSSTASLWSAKAVVCDLREAAVVFGEEDHVTDVCLYTRPGYEELVAETVARLDPRFRVQTQALVRGYVFRGMTLREGVFTVLAAIALVLAIPSFAVMSYLGHTPRRREIGLLKAEGWRTAEVLEMVAMENVLVSVVVAAAATLGALLLVRVWGGPLVASFFLTDLSLFPEMTIPSRFLPLPPVLALMFSLVVTMTGSIYTTWRTATTPAVEVLR